MSLLIQAARHIRGTFSVPTHPTIRLQPNRRDEEVSSLFLRRIGELDFNRHQIAFGSQEPPLLSELSRYLCSEEQRSYLAFYGNGRRRVSKHQQNLLTLRLELIALRNLYRGEREATQLSRNSCNRLRSWLWEAAEEKLASTRRYRMTPNWAREIAEEVRYLPRNHPDRALILGTIAEYQGLVARNPGIREPEPLDPVPVVAERLYEELTGEYRKYVPLLLANGELKELFAMQVIRDGVSLRLFFDHPLAARFLRRTERLGAALRVAGESVRINRNQRPEIRYEDGWAVLSVLPGYPDSFRHLLGWRTSGLGGRHFPLTEAIEGADSRDQGGMVYTKRFGLLPFNPRTWANQYFGRWREVDLDEEEWWTALPPYKTEWVELEDEFDEGWRTEWEVCATQRGAQGESTHAFQCMIIPLGRCGNRVEVGYYPFGEFAYLFEGVSTALRRMRKELTYLDQNLHESGRHIISYQERITGAEAHAMLRDLRQERLETLQEARGEREPSFTIEERNCAWQVRRTARLLGSRGELPTAYPVRFLSTNRVVRAIFAMLSYVPILQKVVHYCMGARGKQLRQVAYVESSYAMKCYFLLRRAIDFLEDRAELYRRSRIPLLPEQVADS